MYSIEQLRDLKGQKLEAELRALEADALKSEREAEWNRLQVAGAEIKYADALASQDFHRIYHFFGIVNGGSVVECVETTGQWSRRDPGADITIVMNSPGGDAIVGLALYDHLQSLRRKGHKITIITRGIAASMGGILLQAADERVMDRNAFMLIHEGDLELSGAKAKVDDSLKFLNKVQTKLLDILCERSTLDREQISTRWDRTDWWMDAEEALAGGFIDRIDS